MPNETATGEKRKQSKSDMKRASKRTKTGGEALVTSINEEHDNTTSTVTETDNEHQADTDAVISNAAKPLSSSSSRTIDDASEVEQATVNDSSCKSIGTPSDDQPSDTLEAVDESAIRPPDAQDVGFTVKGETISFNKPKLSLMERVPEQGARFKGVCDLDNIPFCKLGDYFATNRTKALRLLRYTTEAVGRNMTSMFNVDPQQFSRIIAGNLSRSRRVVSSASVNISDKLKLNSTFYIIGRTVHSALLGQGGSAYSKELSVQPIHRFTPRVASVIAELLDFRRPVLPLRDDGIQFTTTRKPFEESTKEPAYIRHNPMNGVTHGPSPRPWNEPVPIFDGRSHFQLSNYATMERMKRELDVGDFVLVAFTLGGWRNHNVAPNDLRAERVSLNIQFAILLERPVDNDQEGVSARLTKDMKDETPLGVKDTTMMKDILPNELTDAEVAMQIHALSSNFEGPAM